MSNADECPKMKDDETLDGYCGADSNAARRVLENTLANEFIAWVEAYAKKVCPEGCLPTPGQEREINLFARVTRALRAAPQAALPPKLTGELACILEDCGPPNIQTPEALAALIEDYQPTWDRILSTLKGE